MLAKTSWYGRVGRDFLKTLLPVADANAWLLEEIKCRVKSVKTKSFLVIMNPWTGFARVQILFWAVIFSGAFVFASGFPVLFLRAIF